MSLAAFSVLFTCATRATRVTRGIVAAGAAVAVMLPIMAMAQAPEAKPVKRYALTIDAPQALRDLLTQHLEIAKRQDDADVDREALSILVERSQRQAAGLLATEGYFSPLISVTVDDAVQPWPVKMVVREGEPVRIASFEISLVGEHHEAAEAAYQQRKLAERWQIRNGDRFQQATWDSNKNALLREFVADTYPAARISFSEARIDPEGHLAHLKIGIDAGMPYYFGPTQITGVERYPAFLVEQTKPIDEGAPYQQSKLLQMQSALQTMPYFRNAIVTADLADAVGDRIPVQVRVVEARQHRVELGVGVSSNTGARVQAAYSDINIADRGWLFDTRLKLEQKEQTWDNSLRFPTRSDGWNDGIYLNLKADDIKGLKTESALLSFKRERKDTTIDRSVSLNYLWSAEKPEDARSRRVHALYPAWTWTKRDLDDLQYPRSGYVFNLQLAAGVAPILTTESFVRSYAKAIGLLPVGERDSLQIRLEGGTVFTRDVLGVPNDLRFRIGGDQSLRGYGYQSIGIPEGDATVCGRYAAIVGTEYTHWISSDWGVGMFAETGDVFNKGRLDYHSNTGVGFGPRWRSPVGPINIDLGYGMRTHKVLLHFSLGFVF
ncbi:autotransporter assembly complex family protein [soil metagenome]